MSTFRKNVLVRAKVGKALYVILGAKPRIAKIMSIKGDLVVLRLPPNKTKLREVMIHINNLVLISKTPYKLL